MVIHEVHDYEVVIKGCTIVYHRLHTDASNYQTNNYRHEGCTIITKEKGLTIVKHFGQIVVS